MEILPDSHGCFLKDATSDASREGGFEVRQSQTSLHCKNETERFIAPAGVRSAEVERQDRRYH